MRPAAPARTPVRVAPGREWSREAMRKAVAHYRQPLTVPAPSRSLTVRRRGARLRSRGGHRVHFHNGPQTQQESLDRPDISTKSGLLRSVGCRAMDREPVIRSIVVFLNTGTRAGGAWRQEASAGRGDIFVVDGRSALRVGTIPYPTPSGYGSRAEQHFHVPHRSANDGNREQGGCGPDRPEVRRWLAVLDQGFRQPLPQLPTGPRKPRSRLTPQAHSPGM